MATIRSLRYGRRRRVAASLSLPFLPITPWRAFHWCRRRVGAADRNLAALGKAYKTCGHHPLVRFEAAFDNGLDFILLLHNDRTHGHRVVILDDVDEGAGRSALHRAGRNYHNLFERIDQQADVDELPRPKLQVGVREFGLQLHGSGGLVDLVVHDPQHAAIDDFVSVGTLRLDGERALGDGSIQLWQLLLRQVEQRRYRAQLGDHNDRGCGIGGTDVVSLVDYADTGAAVERRRDRRVTQHRASVVDCRLVGLYQSNILRHQS